MASVALSCLWQDRKTTLATVCDGETSTTAISDPRGRPSACAGVTMNLRRGLFRLWIIGSAMFVLAVAFVSYTGIKAEFDAVASTPHLLKANEQVVGLPCANARGTADADYTTVKDDCWYPMTTFRRLYPEHNDLSDDAIKLDPVLRIATRINPWATLGLRAGIAFGIPLAVLAFGASLVWALSGFAATRQP